MVNIVHYAIDMKIIGHRGAAGLAPENTLRAIKTALKYGVDKIEIDARLNQSGTPVLSHDPVISRQAVSLSRAIETINRSCPLIIEIKPHENPRRIFDVIERFLSLGWLPSDFEIASFEYAILKSAKRQLPQIPLTVLEKWSGVRATSRARRLGTRSIAMNQRWLWQGFISLLSRSGFKLAAYTVNNPRQAEHWQKAGLAAIITDYPDRF